MIHCEVSPPEMNASAAQWPQLVFHIAQHKMSSCNKSIEEIKGVMFPSLADKLEKVKFNK